MDDSHATPESTAETSPAKQPGGLARGIRRVLTVVVVAAACYVAYGFGGLWGQWRQATHMAPHNSAATNIPSMVPMLPLAGHWSFGDLDWNLRSSLVEPEVVATRFEELAALTADGVAERLQDVSPELIELAHNLEIEPVERNGNQVYAHARPDFKAQLVARNISGKPKAIALAAAYAMPTGQWQLLEFSPRAATDASNAASPHLMPLPPDAQRSGGRFADEGGLLLELVTLQASADDLLASWKSDGWDVRPSGLGDSGQFSYLCARDGEVIYAWSADSGDSLRNLMLVRTPDSTDTSP